MPEWYISMGVLQEALFANISWRLEECISTEGTQKRVFKGINKEGT
jgi:hypothetical protein